jgi:hypothetical protein
MDSDSLVEIITPFAESLAIELSMKWENTSVKWRLDQVTESVPWAYWGRWYAHNMGSDQLINGLEGTLWKTHILSYILYTYLLCGLDPTSDLSRINNYNTAELFRTVTMSDIPKYVIEKSIYMAMQKVGASSYGGWNSLTTLADVNQPRHYNF